MLAGAKDDGLSDLRTEIIEAGYKAMVVKNHPDSAAVNDKASREETCKRLAVARDWLLGMLQVDPSVAAPRPPTMNEAYVHVSMPRPIITPEGVDRFFNNVVDLFFGERPKRPRKPRPVAPRRPRI